MQGRKANERVMRTNFCSNTSRAANAVTVVPESLAKTRGVYPKTNQESACFLVQELANDVPTRSGPMGNAFYFG